ncbi:MAG: SCPU domain-containing protein [Betaproteobacteria bacterium]|nr:MAG: SCPU domain-containing protein [Betaproteobacteria bacterium]
MRTATGLVVRCAFLLGVGMAASATFAVTCSIDLPVINLEYKAIVDTLEPRKSITIRCNAANESEFSTTPFRVKLSNGHALGGAPSRHMKNGFGAVLHYNIFSLPGTQTPWGDDTTWPSVSAFFGSGGTQRSAVLPLYIIVPKNQWMVPAGQYNDSLEVTVSF